jgi:hypothetical protein
MPYVIGGLWNAQARPPEGVDDSGNNAVKLIRSRNGVTFRIRDDAAKESLTIETNGNSITLSPSGIIVNASAKVTVNASAVEVNAGMVTINAGMSRFNGAIQCETLISNAVVSPS